MNIIGLSGGVKSGNQDGAAALMIDGRLVAMAEEERFVGVKFANGLLPRHAVKWCLEHAGISIRDIDLIVFAGATYEDFESILQRFFVFHFGHSPRVGLCDHHLAHAASAYYSSGFDDALVLTMDFSGDRRSTTVHAGCEGRLELLADQWKPDSLGIYFSAVTQYLGFQRDSDEYKVMGMAGYGRDTFDLSHILEVGPKGYRFHHDFIRGLEASQPSPGKQEPLFDSFPLPHPPRVPGSPFERVHFDIAASAQAQLERAVVSLVRHHLEGSGKSKVCMAGGVALNCLMAQRVRECPGVSELYLPPVCSDAGLALGAAYLTAVEAKDSVEPLGHAYHGPSHGHDEIRHALDRAGCRYEETSDPAGAAAELIAAGSIVGWHQGRLEIGPRALGGRSILADPRGAGVKDQINSRVKMREEFRPFAPSVRHEDGPSLFDGYADSPYMTQTFTALPGTMEAAPAVVHVDGTSRIQSVHRSTNPMYDELLAAFERLTGLPMVLNTSLNAFGDPIAADPVSALRTYFTTGLDALVMGPFVLRKR